MASKEAKAVLTIGRDLLGTGDVIYCWQPRYNYLACVGDTRVVYILDRQGKKISEMQLESMNPVTSMDWDMDGETLAILQNNETSVTVWNVSTRNYTVLDISNNTGDRATFIKWSKTHLVLAIGSEKGSLTFYNKQTQRKIPTVGKHSKQVISGDWNDAGYLITGADDKMLTISTHNGDTHLQSMKVGHEPQQIQWARYKGTDEELVMVTTVLNSKLLCLQDMKNAQPIELQFQTKYGRIVEYAWFGNGNIILGFSEGWVCTIDVHMPQVGNELSAAKIFNTTLDALCVCDMLGKVAVAGDGSIRVFTLNPWKESRSDKIDLPYNAGRVISIHWMFDGQILTVATQSGNLYGYLMQMPSLNASFGSMAAVLNSLTEVTILDCANGGNVLTTISLELEPTIMSMGSYHVGVGSNTMVMFYRWRDSTNDLIVRGLCTSKRDYRNSVKQVVNNQTYAAILTDGQVILHTIEESDEVKEKIFPEKGQASIDAIQITPQFLIMVDQENRIKYFFIEEMTMIAEFKADTNISRIYPNVTGTRMVALDMQGGGYLYSPINDAFLKIPKLPSGVQRIIWDNFDHNFFIACDSENAYGFIYTPVSLQGPVVESVQELLSIEDLEQPERPAVTILDKEIKPLVLTNGQLCCFSEASGSARGNYLSSHSYLDMWRGRNDNTDGHYKYFLQNLSIKRFKDCYSVAEKLNNEQISEALGNIALKNLELEIAEKAFQLSKNVGIVYTIQQMKNETEKLVLLGQVALILHQHDAAQDFFLKSTQPHYALDMRCDLQDWLIALKLARSVDPNREPIICKKLAQQLEDQENYGEALRLYENASKTLQGMQAAPSEIEGHMLQTYAGIARTCIRMGDVARGFKIANEINDLQLKVDCANVCEQMKQLSEAAQLYERGGQPEKAASIYIQLKQWKNATQLMELITTPKLLIQLGKAKETEGSLKEAEEAFEKAGDWENVVRINLQKLNNLEKARNIATEKCPTETAATMVAEEFERQGNRGEAIKFLVMAGKKEDAFAMAQSFDLMDSYSNSLLEERNNEEHLKIALFYEGKSKFGRAALHYEKAGDPSKSMKLYEQSGEDYYEDAIKMLGRLKDENLSTQFYYFLIGEVDGIPKDAKYIYQLNMALGKIQEASSTAILIAQEEQESGNYEEAHKILFSTIRDMKFNKLRIPMAMHNKLMLVHSYILVKRFVKMQDHLSAAYMLVRVAKNISSFPAHIVQILTSTVIECTRAGLKMAAYNWACVLVQPKNREKLDPKIKKQIENVAIKRPRDEDPEEETFPCPYCKSYNYASELECLNCKNAIPYCIASGKSMVLNEWTNCPNCRFPGILSSMLKITQDDPRCPMCSEPVNGNALKLNPDPMLDLKTMLATDEDEETQ